MHIHQFAPTLLYGDAVGNQVLLLRRLLREAGYTSDIYVEHIDPHYANEAHDFREYNSQPDNIVIYHHAIGCQMANVVCTLPEQIVPYYHNITPPACFLGFNQPLHQWLIQGREQLAALAKSSHALAGSEFNREEMLQVGYPRVDVLPYIVEMNHIDADLHTPAAEHTRARLRDGKVNWLFVGRISPNKRQDNLLRAFHYYHTLVNPNSRLILIGSNTTAPAYGIAVQMQAHRLQIEDAVEFVGRVGADSSLGAYYQSADVFVCLSEHEGFCVPLLESMHFDVPIVALNKTAVPYTLGDAGIMVSDYRFDLIAEIVDQLQRDYGFRQHMIEAQRRRMETFATVKIADQLNRSVAQWLTG